MSDQESVELIFRGDESRKEELERPCNEVLKHFQLPKQILVAIFDDEERPEFTSSPRLGENICGFLLAIRRYGIGNVPWPIDIKNQLWDNINQEWRCDVLIYIRNRTCQSPTGAVITFAHELQHFTQYGFRRKAFQGSHDIQRIFEQSGRSAAPWDFPHEFEAQGVSRRVAENVCGRGEVRRYAEQQIGLKLDPEKWKFFIGPETEKPFDLLEATNSLIGRHREALIALRPTIGEEFPDYKRERWWD